MNFTTIFKEQDKLYKSKYFYIVKDGFPVSPGHLLIISNEVKKDFFALNKEEQNEFASLVSKAKELIEKKYKPDGYNIGMNCGEPAGQTVFHFHCHIIPRYKGDILRPEGGVRHCVEGKGYH